MITINQDTTAYLTVNFLDKNGNAAEPLTVSYSIQCLTNSKDVRPSTDLTPASSIEIMLTTTDNGIIDQNNLYEDRKVIIDASYGEDDTVKATYTYRIQNIIRA